MTLARRHDPDLFRVAKMLVRSGMPPENAMAAAGTPPYRRAVRTFTPPVAECVRSLQEVRKKYQKMDHKGKEGEEAAKARGESNVRKYVPLFL